MFCKPQEMEYLRLFWDVFNHCASSFHYGIFNEMSSSTWFLFRHAAFIIHHQKLCDNWIKEKKLCSRYEELEGTHETTNRQRSFSFLVQLCHSHPSAGVTQIIATFPIHMCVPGIELGKCIQRIRLSDFLAIVRKTDKKIGKFNTKATKVAYKHSVEKSLKGSHFDIRQRSLPYQNIWILWVNETWGWFSHTVIS